MDSIFDSTPQICDFVDGGVGRLQNITWLRRFTIGLLKDKKRNETIPEMMKKLMLNTRAVFDYLKMTRNSNPGSIG